MKRGRISDIAAGDMLGCSSCSALGWVINICTLGFPFWDLSHVQLAIQWPDFQTPLIAESTDDYRQPCVLQGQLVDGVQFHWLRPRIIGYPGKVYRYPIREPLSEWQHRAVRRWLAAHLRAGYDAAGAVGARDMPIGALTRAPEDTVSLFCSELVAGCYRAAGLLETDNVSSWSPNRLARHLVKKKVLLPRVRIK